jgi:hypothetical protein
MPLKSSEFDTFNSEGEDRDERYGEDKEGPYGEGLAGTTGMNPFAGMESNPAVSAKQQRFMGMCAHNPGKASGKCPSHKVAEEFSHKG